MDLKSRVDRDLIHSRRGPWLASLLITLVAIGCGTPQSSKPAPSESGLRLSADAPGYFKKVGLVCDAVPAAWMFQRAKGKLGAAKEGIADGVELVAAGFKAAPGAATAGVYGAELVTAVAPQLQEDAAWAPLAAVGGVAAVGVVISAPLASYKVVRSWMHLNPEELARVETDLAQAMTEMAEAEHFRARLLKTTDEVCPGRLVLLLPEALTNTTRTKCDAVLEASVKELRLQRMGKGEGSYALRILLHVRLFNPSNGQVYCDQPIEYRSRPYLFVDLAPPSVFKSEAGIGYMYLAEHIVQRLLISRSLPRMPAEQ